MKKIINLLFVTIMIFCSCNKEQPTKLIADFEADKTEITAGEKVIFFEKSSGNPVRWNWTFDGGTPESSPLNSPEVIYERPGTYNVSLKIQRGESEDVLVKERYITVNYPAMVKAAFKANKVNLTNEEKVILSDMSTGIPDHWKWTLTSNEGDIFTSELQNPEFLLVPGIYTVTLEVSSPVAEDKIIKEDYLTVIDVNSVIAQFKTPDQLIVEGSSARFMDMSLGRVTGWEWSFEGGKPEKSTMQNPVVEYEAAGTYKVTLRAYNDKKESIATKDTYVTVLPSKDLIMYYPFEGNMQDYGPNHILAEEKSSGNFVPIRFDSPSRKEGSYCAEFTRVDDDNYTFLALENSEKLETGSSPVTTSFWVKTGSKKYDNYAVYQHGPTKDSNENKSKQAWFRLQNNKEYGFYAISVEGQPGNWVKYTKSPMTDGQWHHYVTVYDAGDAYIYIDGNLVAEVKGKPSKVIVGNPYFIGVQDVTKTNTANSFRNFMDGCIDDFIVYNRAFSDTEVKEFYNKVK